MENDPADSGIVAIGMRVPCKMFSLGPVRLKLNGTVECCWPSMGILFCIIDEDDDDDEEASGEGGEIGGVSKMN